MREENELTFGYYLGVVLGGIIMRGWVIFEEGLVIFYFTGGLWEGNLLWFRLGVLCMLNTNSIKKIWKASCFLLFVVYEESM